jgi:hypothetical protein
MFEMNDMFVLENTAKKKRLEKPKDTPESLSWGE